MSVTGCVLTEHSEVHIHHGLEPNIFPSGPPTQSISYMYVEIDFYCQNRQAPLSLSLNYTNPSLYIKMNIPVMHRNYKFVLLEAFDSLQG